MKTSFLKSFKQSIIAYLNIKFQFFGAPIISKIEFEKSIISSSYYKKTQPSVTINKQQHWKFNLVKEVFYPETFVTVLKQGKVWGNEGLVISAENILYNEVSRHYNETTQELPIFKLSKVITPEYKDATVAVISAAGAQIYYHWMIDIVPRVSLLINSGYFDIIDYFVLDYTGLSFQKELLKKLNIDENRVIRCNGFNTFHLQARDLVVPSYLSPNDAPDVKACDFLRELFKNELSKKTPERKLYLQRKRGRRLTNEEELAKLLQIKGFEIIQAENLTVSQQASIFSEASFIVAPHGAGLTNLIFCQPGTKVIDLFSPEWVNPCYAILSSHLNILYGYLIGEGETFPEDFDPVGKNSDIKIDVSKFNELFDLIERKITVAN